jgi:hypothetical protein
MKSQLCFCFKKILIYAIHQFKIILILTPFQLKYESRSHYFKSQKNLNILHLFQKCKKQVYGYLFSTLCISISLINKHVSILTPLCSMYHDDKLLDIFS